MKLANTVTSAVKLVAKNTLDLSTLAEQTSRNLSLCFLRDCPAQCHQPELLAHLGFDRASNFRIFFQMLFGVLAPLANALAGERVPGPGLFDDPQVGANVDQLPFFRHAAAVENVELRFFERWSNLVLHHLDLGAI